MLSIFVITTLLSLASFSADVSTECDVEYVSYSSNPKLEKARKDFVKSRDEYRAFYSANKETLEAGRKLRGRMSGVLQVLHAEESKGNDLVKRYQELEQQLKSGSYKVVEAQLRERQDTYELCLHGFVGHYLRHIYPEASLEYKRSRSELFAKFKVQLGIMSAFESLIFHQHEEVKAWRGK